MVLKSFYCQFLHKRLLLKTRTFFSWPIGKLNWKPVQLFQNLKNTFPVTHTAQLADILHLQLKLPNSFQRQFHTEHKEVKLISSEHSEQCPKFCFIVFVYTLLFSPAGIQSGSQYSPPLFYCCNNPMR